MQPVDDNSIHRDSTELSQHDDVRVSRVSLSIKGGRLPFAREVESLVSDSQFAEAIRTIVPHEASSLVINLKKGAKEARLEISRDSVTVIFPAEIKDKTKGLQLIRALILSRATVDCALDVATVFFKTSHVPENLRQQFERSLDLFGREKSVTGREALYEAVQYHKQELGKLRQDLKKKVDVAVRVHQGSDRNFLEKQARLRAVSELIGSGTDEQKQAHERIFKVVNAYADALALPMHQDSGSLVEELLGGLESFRASVAESACLQFAPLWMQPLAPKARPSANKSLLVDVLNSPLFPERGYSRDFEERDVARSPQVLDPDALIVGLNATVANLKRAADIDRELRNQQAHREPAEELLIRLVEVALYVPEELQKLETATHENDLADLTDLVKILVSFKFCTEDFALSFYEYLASGIPIEVDRDRAARNLNSASQVSVEYVEWLQVLAMLQGEQPADAAKKLLSCRDNIVLMSFRALRLIVYSYQAVFGSHLSQDAQYNPEWEFIPGDLNVIEEGLTQLAPLIPSPRLRDAAYSEIREAMAALRTTLDRFKLSGLNDDDLTSHIGELLGAVQAGTLTARMEELSGRLVQRIEAHAVSIASGVREYADNLTSSGRIEPLCKFANRYLNLLELNPDKEEHQQIQGAVVEAFQDFLGALYEYWAERMQAVTAPEANVESVIEGLEALYLLITELRHFREQLDTKKKWLPEQMWNKAAIQIDQAPKHLARALERSPELLREIVQRLFDEWEKQKGANSPQLQARIAGLQWARVRSRVFDSDADTKGKFLKMSRPRPNRNDGV